MLPAADFLQI